MNPRSLLLTALLLLAACGPKLPSGPPFQATEKYKLSGEIVSLRADEHVAVIKHQEIVGWMKAMTMDFPVYDEAGWKRLAPGKRIEATVFVGDGGYYVGEIRPAKD